MMFTTIARALLIASALSIATAQSVLAHALPGTVMAVSQDERALALNLTVNVEDLVIAEPGLAALHEAPLGPIQAGALRDAVAGYFAGHLQIERKGAAVDLQLVDLELVTDQSTHVGMYRALALTFSAELDGPALPLVITYDAVMHEVRTHRTQVQWISGAGGPVELAEFGFRRVDGQIQPVHLTAPGQ